MSATCLCFGSRRDFKDHLSPSLIFLPEETDAQRGGMVCSGSPRAVVPGVSGTRTASAQPGSQCSHLPLRLLAPGEQSPALFSSPSPVIMRLKASCGQGERQTEKKAQEHFKRMKNFSHQHFLFRPEFMNFNQINTGMLGINICTIMQNNYYGCNEN